MGACENDGIRPCAAFVCAFCEGDMLVWIRFLRSLRPEGEKHLILRFIDDLEVVVVSVAWLGNVAFCNVHRLFRNEHEIVWAVYGDVIGVICVRCSFQTINDTLDVFR